MWFNWAIGPVLVGPGLLDSPAMEVIGRRGQSFAELVDELDDRLPRDPEIIPDAPPRRRLRLGAIGLVMLLAMAGWLAVRTEAGLACEFDQPVCAIEHLDIDAVLLAVPDADLFDVLPPVEVIDPRDEMTLAEVLRLDRLADYEANQLIRASEVERVLQHLE